MTGEHVVPGPAARQAGPEPAADAAAPRPRARDLNQLIRYTMWSVFKVTDRASVDLAGREALAAEVCDLIEQAAGKDVVTRGCYDVQEMYVRFRRTGLGRACEPVWSAMALHRPAEFNKSHIPAFLAGEPPRDYVCVYPFVRSYEWYLLDDSERRAMLAEHGQMAREYPDVRANTVSAFALGDYEWLLAFEADELHRIVDLMRHLRGASARRHTRVEIPFYTGRRKPVSELLAALA